MDERKRKSKRQESIVAKELSGRVQPASGALWGAKADVRSDLFLVECKTTAKDYYQLSFNVWDKINREALKEGMRIPVMCIDLNDGKERVAVMRTDDLMDFPVSYSLSVAKDLSNGKTTYRVRYTEGGNRIFLSNTKKDRSYDVHTLPWSVFLSRLDLYDTKKEG